MNRRPPALGPLSAVCAAGPWIAHLPRIGPVRVNFDSIGDALTMNVAGDAVFALGRGADWGCLAIDGLLALAVVSAALGRPAPRLVRSLGRAERGVLVANLAGLLQSLGSGWRVSVASPPPVQGESIVLTGSVQALGMTALAHIEAPLAWAPPSVFPPVSRLEHLPVVGHIELARTALTVRDWLAVEVGDAIVFDGIKAGSAEDVWSVKLRIGAHAARAHLDPTGDLRLRDGFRPAPVASGRLLRKKRSPMPDRPGERTEETTAPMVLSSAPIEVVAELGRVELRGDEVLSLERGGVVTFAGLRAMAPVALRVGGDVWAWGELVDVDGELGVRITDITARADPASAKP